MTLLLDCWVSSISGTELAFVISAVDWVDNLIKVGETTVSHFIKVPIKTTTQFVCVLVFLVFALMFVKSLGKSSWGIIYYLLYCWDQSFRFTARKRFKTTNDSIDAWTRCSLFFIARDWQDSFFFFCLFESMASAERTIVWLSSPPTLDRLQRCCCNYMVNIVDCCCISLNWVYIIIWWSYSVLKSIFPRVKSKTSPNLKLEYFNGLDDKEPSHLQNIEIPRFGPKRLVSSPSLLFTLDSDLK